MACKRTKGEGISVDVAISINQNAIASVILTNQDEIGKEIRWSFPTNTARLKVVHTKKDVVFQQNIMAYLGKYSEFVPVVQRSYSHMGIIQKQESH